MATLGNVNIDGLSLSPAMQSDLASGMSVTAFNSKYAGSGFQPIALTRQVGAAAPAPAAAAPGNVSQPLFDFAAQQRAESDALLARQRAEQQGLFDQYTQKIGSQEQLPALYQRLQQEAGIPELSGQAQAFKDEIYRVKGLLDRLGEDVTSRTQGTLTTESMRNRIIAAEGDPLRTNLARLGTGLQPVADMLTSAQGQLSTVLPLYMQQQDRELRPLEMQIDALGDRFAREITGFNSNKETQLTAILDKLTRDRELSDREWQLAQDLAAEEREFSRQKQLAAASASYLNPPASTQSGSNSAVRQLPSVQPLGVSQGAPIRLQAGNSGGSINTSGRSTGITLSGRLQ